MRLLCLCFTLLIQLLNAQNPLFIITEKGKQGAIDSTGKVIIPPIFKTIKSFSEGLAAARNEKGNYGYIDTNGQWKIPPQYDYATEFIDGLAIVFKNRQPFYINNQGEMPLIVPKNTFRLTPFWNGVARVETGKEEDYNHKVGLINKKGQWLLKPLDATIIVCDSHSITVIKRKSKHFRNYYTEGVLDTLGRWIQPMSHPSEKYPYCFLGTTHNKSDLNADSPLKLKEDKNGMTYFDKARNIIWQSSNHVGIDTLDIDYKCESNYPAYSKFDEYDVNNKETDWNHIHFEHPIAENQSFEKNKLSVIISPINTVHLKQKWIGYKAFIANNSKQKYIFETTDYQLWMNLQALDETEQWRDIQNQPLSSGCTSGGSATLIPKQYWQFEIATFKGIMKTRLRLKVAYLKNRNGKLHYLYSNEIEGSINPAQFWKSYRYKVKTLLEEHQEESLN